MKRNRRASWWRWKKESEKAGLILNIQKTKIMVSGPSPSWQIHGEKMETVRDLIFLGSKITVGVDSSHEIKRRLLFGRKAMTNLDSILKRRDIALPTKVHLSTQSYGFSRSYVWMWELNQKESWVPNNGWFHTVVLEKSLESSLGSKEIKSVNPKGNHPWIFIRRTVAEAEAPILWLPDMKRWFIGKDPNAGKDWRQEGKWVIEDEIAG